MTEPRRSDAESRRLAALHALRLLDTEPEERFDRITRLTQLQLAVPIALITLLDADRQWFKSRRGTETTEMPRALSFCTLVVERDEFVAIPDLAADARFARHPLVTGEPRVRFYAGVPVHAPGGEPVGTVCVLDRQPREFGPELQEGLSLLAAVTERELQSRELADTLALVGEVNSRAAAVADSIIEGLITLDDDGRITSANRAASAMFRYEASELVGATAVSLLDDRDREAYQEYLDRYRRGEGSRVLGTHRQVTGKRADRSTFDMELIVTSTEAGSHHEFVALCRDVSDRVRMERELYASQERLEFLSDAALEGLAVRENGVVAEANRAFTEIFGYEQDEVIGMAPIDFLASESHALLATYFSEHEGELVEAVGQRKDGTRFPIEFAARDLSAGGFDRRVVAIRDITARREAEERAEAELRESRAARRTIRAIVDAAREAMLFLGADGRIAFVNQGLYNLFTRGQAVDLRGRRVEDFPRAIAAALGPSGDAFIDAVRQSQLEADSEIVVILEQQRPLRRDLQLVIRPVFDPDAGYTGRLLVFRDITAERETDRLKSEFLSTVAHELRAPLASIKGYVELLLEGDAGGLAEDQERLLAVVDRNADRLAALVSDLLDVAQLEAGGLELRRAPTRVDRLIADAVAVLRPQFDDKEQQLAVEAGEHLPPIAVDSGRIVQAVTNLLSNAHKYTPAGGHIAIRARSVEDALEITVQDDGIGLSPDEIEQLFTKFYRARNRTTLEVGGTGLGLSITRSLVELHGGTIEVESAPDRGAAFTMRLPLRDSGERGAPGGEHAGAS